MKTKLLLLLLLANFSIYAQTNLVSNGDFETWTAYSQPTDWFRYSNGLLYQDSNAQKGSSSTKMEITSGTFHYMNSSPFATQSGKTYRVTMYHKLVSGTITSVELSLTKADIFKTPITKKAETTSFNSAWQKIEFDYVATTTQNAEISIWIKGITGTQILVDNVSIVDVAEIGPKYTLIPDVNFENKLISLGYDSGAPDGQVRTANISGVTDLYLSFDSITDLTGIEDFTSLTSLKSYYNNITTVDLSKNLALKEIRFDGLKQSTLNVSSNIKLEKLSLVRTSLSSIDVTANVNLQELVISSGGYNTGEEGSGLFTSLDLSHNPNLKIFECNGQKLPNFDFSSHPQLESISFDASRATSFDFSANIALKSLSINNSFLLENIDLSNNINLRELYISNTKIINLDLSHNPAMRLLRCTDAKSLETINLKNGNNAIINPSTLYLTQTPSLHCILVDDPVYSESNWSVSKENWVHYSSVCQTPQYTTIPDVEFEKVLMLKRYDGVLDGKVLTSLIASVKELDLKYSTYDKISDLTGIEGFTALEKLTVPPHDLLNLDLSKNIALKTLNCSSVNLNALDITNNINLVTLDCGNNNLSTLNLTKNIALNELNISSNKFKDIDLSENKALVKLILINNNFTTVDLSKNTKLNYLDSRLNYQLKCVQVAEVDYALANWSIYKEAITSFNLDCNEYTLIPDDNFEQKLIDLGIDKDGKNGKVQTSSIASVTSLDVQSSNIKDLTGIQDFTSLTYLNCSTNTLTSLDLSKNTALENLYGQKNELTSLNTSANKSLKVLNLANNKLSSLDISALTKLEELNVSSNAITTLNVSASKALASLNCGNNKLTSLNVTANTALTTLYCFNNQITSLDVSSNVLLENFMCQTNKLTALNVSKNPALIMLDCFENQITSLDISNNPKITELACNNNLLTSLNLKNGNNTKLALTFSNFKNNAKLTCIQVDNETYSNDKWSAIKDATANYNVDCRPYTLIPDAAFEDKLIALQIDKDGKNGKVVTASIASVTTLDVSSSSIKDLTGIQDFASLKVLNCSTNQLTSLTPANNLTLTELNVSYNALTTLDVSKNKALTALNVSNNNLNSLNVKNGFNTNMDWFSVNFTKNPSLSCIQVDDAKYSNDNWNGKLDKTSFFTENCGSYTLIPDSNFEDKLIALKIDIDGKNGKVLTSTISTVKDLNVQLSDIKDLTGIEDFTSLEFLNCQFNLLTSLNVSKNSKLIELYTHGNDLTTLDVSTNPALTTLYANKNKITALDLSKNSKLVYVNVTENSLKTLNLKNGNNINFTGALLNKNTSLTCITVDNPSFAASSSVFFKDTAASYSATCTLGIEDSVFSKATVFPNPTKGEVNINNVSLEKATVYNSLGQLVKTFVFNNGETSNTINLSGLPRGVYFVYLISGDAASAKKIIVE